MSDTVLFIDETRQDIAIVHIMAQRLLEPRQADTLSRHLVGLFESGVLCVLVDMGGVQRLSSIFFRAFIMAGKKAGEKKARLAFCNLPPSIHEGFTITGLTDLFPIYKNENDALGKLAGK